MNKDNKIRILYLVSRLQRHGPIFQLYNIIKYLDRSRFDPHLVTLSPETGSSLLPAFERIDVEFSSLGLSRMKGVIFGAKSIKKLLEDSPADLIHSSDYRSVLLCANNSIGIPRVITCRQAFDHTHYTLHGGIDPISSRLIPRTLEMACMKCERVVGVSDFVRRSAKQQLATRMDVIHNGIDQDAFRTLDKEETAAMRSKLGLPLDKYIFLTSGLSKRKDPITVVRAFFESKASLNAVLVLLGEGNLREECSHLAATKDHIHIVGFVDNVRDYLSAADVFVSASLTEGCPNAVMEAMACGLPVILSDIPAHREILDFDKRAGLLFPTKDIDSLSDAFSKSLDGDYSEKSRAALNIINNHLNAKMMSLKYQELYAELCG
jgi:glycosyltransferase involved in cell wall biosynthesis